MINSTSSQVTITMDSLRDDALRKKFKNMTTQESIDYVNQSMDKLRASAEKVVARNKNAKI